MELSKEQQIIAAAEKLVRCKGRYHSEQNYRALAALFGVTVPDLPPLGGEQQPVAWEVKGILCHSLDEAKRYVGEPEPLYLHPQQVKAVQVPGDVLQSIDALAKLNNQLYRWTSRMSYNGSWVGEPEGLIKGHIREMEHILDSCRAAMLTSEPVSNRDELADEVTDGMQQSKATMLQWLHEGKQIFDPAYLKDEEGNSPAIPDGWVLVPKVASQDHLESIALRDRHDFGLLTGSHRDYALDSARKMYEECTGQGFHKLPDAPQGVPEMSKSEKFDIALSRAMENNKDTLAALAKK